jgi:hypothetical protein
MILKTNEEKETFFMKSQSLARFRTAIATYCAVMFSIAIFAFRVQADQWDKKTILTVDRPIQVQDKLLEPRQNVFKLQDSNSDRHIVQILNAVLAIPNYRLQPTGHSRFAFWETPPGGEGAARLVLPGRHFRAGVPVSETLAMLAMTTPALPPSPSPSTAGLFRKSLPLLSSNPSR